MKNCYTLLRNTFFLSAILLILSIQDSMGQCGSALGNQTTYGTNYTWIGYIYQGKNFDNYYGYVNEGSAASSSSNFDESFGGANVSYSTNGCAVITENFSARYKLTQTFANANYLFTVGGDDGYRLSLDGGATWVINKWNDQSYNTTTYTVALNGAVNMVLEYYENGGDNRISFNVTPLCTGTGDPSVYGTGNIWNGYIYQGMNFDQYKGSVTEGISTNPAFDESFGNAGGSNTATYVTNSCSITTFQFSARFRLQQTLTAAHYNIIVGGDDGYRFSLDGGSTWVINNWGDHSYTVSSYNATLSGPVNMVLEYYDNGGGDRVSFSMNSTTLPVTLTNWSVAAVSAQPGESLLKWQANNAINFDHYIVQRSNDGISFEDLHSVKATKTSSATSQDYSYTDNYPDGGTIYYRLVMVDIDGTMSYSTILSIALGSSKNVSIYPTIVDNGNLFIASTSIVPQARLEIFDMSGRRVQQKEWATLDGRQQVSIGGNGSLPAGAYIARFSGNNSVLAKQVILIR